MLRFPGSRVIEGLGCPSTSTALFKDSIDCLLVSREGVFAAMKVSLGERVSGEGGSSDSSSISTGDDLLDPGLLDVHPWWLVPWEIGFMAPWAQYSESYSSCSDAAETAVIGF